MKDCRNCAHGRYNDHFNTWFCYHNCECNDWGLWESADVDWIPVSERLPKTGDDILVTFSDGEVDIIISARPKAWVKYEEANNLIFPVAWMPLPTPYKGGDDE